MDNSYSIIAKCTIENRNLAITVDRKILENINGKYIEVSENDSASNILKKYTKLPKSLDIENM